MFKCFNVHIKQLSMDRAWNIEWKHPPAASSSSCSPSWWVAVFHDGQNKMSAFLAMNCSTRGLSFPSAFLHKKTTHVPQRIVKWIIFCQTDCCVMHRENQLYGKSFTRESWNPTHSQLLLKIKHLTMDALFVHSYSRLTGCKNQWKRLWNLYHLTKSLVILIQTDFKQFKG